jgi:hypothetical protein
VANVARLLNSRDTDLVCAAANSLAHFANRRNGPSILWVLRSALRREPTVAGKATLRAASRLVRQQTGRQVVEPAAVADGARPSRS